MNAIRVLFLRLRAAAFAGAVAAISFTLVAGTARADAGELIESAATREAVNAVLDAFEQRCAGVSGGVGARLSELLRTRSRSTQPQRSLEPVVRGGDADNAHVGCLP